MNERLEQGDTAPAFSAQDWNGLHHTIPFESTDRMLLCFFRYASCPLCNLRAQELIKNYDALKSAGISVVAVFQSPSERIAHYVGKQQPPFPLLPDPKLKLYRLYRVESSWMGFFRAWTLGISDIAKAVLGRKFLPGTVENQINRIPADFLISNKGKLLIVYYGKDIGDHLPLDSLLNK